MIQKVHTFRNCTATVEDIPHPETGKLDGRAMIIIDNDTGDVYRMPLSLEHAQLQGKRLMGIEQLELADGADLSKLLGRKNGS